jgi:hypothetical protein
MAEQDTSLYVVATTLAGTTEALRHAGRLADGRRRIVLLIPVPYTTDASLLSARLIDDYTRVATAAGVIASAYGLVCKQPADIFKYFPIGPEATVVVGSGRAEDVREEHRLAEALRAMGHAVVFVRADNDGSASPTSDVA